MAREQAHTGKRNAILDAAMSLVYTKGYEQMTIQDMLDALHISKGSFYYYFDSKLTFFVTPEGRQGPNLSAAEPLCWWDVRLRA